MPVSQEQATSAADKQGIEMYPSRQHLLFLLLVKRTEKVQQVRVLLFSEFKLQHPSVFLFFTFFKHGLRFTTCSATFGLEATVSLSILPVQCRSKMYQPCPIIAI